MSIVNADTDILKAGGHQLKGASDNLQEMANQLNQIVNGLDRSIYDGQFAQQVANILSGGFNKATDLKLTLYLAGTSIHELAKNIDLVNNYSCSAFDTTNSQITELCEKSPNIEEFSKRKLFQPPTKEGYENQRYYQYGRDIGDEEKHPGIDIPGEKGTPVYPIGDGKIVRIHDDKSGYGRYIVIEHTLPDGTKTYSLYAHLDEQSTAGLKEGQEVAQNTIIGNIGETGNWNNIYHLHLETRTSEGYDPNFPMKIGYSDTKEDDWSKYWLNPREVINSSKYQFKTLAL